MRPQRKPGRALRLTFWAAATFAFVMAALPHPLELPGAPSDKIQHIAAFVTLGLLSRFAYPAISAVQLALRLSLFGAAIELVQAMPLLHRDSSVLDWIADTVACSAALAAVSWWRSTRKRANRTHDLNGGD